jgi:hypothetical protein
VWATDYTERKRLPIADQAIIQKGEPCPGGMLLIP